MSDEDAFIGFYVFASVVAYPRGFVVQDFYVLVFLRVYVDFFLFAFVFKADFVVALSFVGVAFPGASGFVFRQFIGRRVEGVVGASADYGLVGVAVKEVDDDFLPDSRDGLLSVSSSYAPALRYAYPAGAVLVVLARAVPGELDFDAALFVGVDFFALRAYDVRDLRARKLRFGGDAGFPVGCGGDEPRGLAVAGAYLRFGGFFFASGVLFAAVFDAYRPPQGVHVFACVAC